MALEMENNEKKNEVGLDDMIWAADAIADKLERAEKALVWIHRLVTDEDYSEAFGDAGLDLEGDLGAAVESIQNACDTINAVRVKLHRKLRQ